MLMRNEVKAQRDGLRLGLQFEASLSGIQQLLDALHHGGFVTLKGLDHFELYATAIKILVGSVYLEIGIALKVVGQETEPDLERDEFCREYEMVLFGLAE